jgi:ribosomal protein S18 acetylase RimI-like enzyme
MDPDEGSARGLEVRAAQPTDDPAILHLWHDADLVRPWNDPVLDLARKRADSPWGLLVAVRDDRVVGTVMVGYDGHRGAINYLAVAPAERRHGIGSALMDVAERLLGDRGCPKIALSVRSEHSAVRDFYASRGYLPEPGVGTLGLRLVVDGPSSSKIS